MGEQLGRQGSAPVEIDIGVLIETHGGIIGNPGAGKSRTIRKILELAAGKAQRIVFDVEDEFYTLREMTASMIIAGGQGGDCAAAPSNAADLARFLLKTGIDAVIQLNDLGLDGQREFITEFLPAMIEAPQNLWHPTIVVLDEVQRVAPLNETSEAMRAVSDLLFRGRKRNFAALIASQRLARVHTDVRGAVNNWLMGRVGQSIDRNAVADMMGVRPAGEEARGLSRLTPGHFWCFGPAISVEPILVHVDGVKTTHLRPGQHNVPTPPAPEQIRAMLAQLQVTPKTAGPAQNGRSTADVQVDQQEALRAAEKRGYDRGHAAGLAAGEVAGRRTVIDTVGTALRSLDGNHLSAFTIHNPAPDAAAPLMPTGKQATLTITREGIRPTSVKIIEALRRAHPRLLSFAAAAARAGVSRRSSQYSLYEREVRASGEIEEVNGRLRANLPMPGGDIMPVEAWIAQLPPSYGRMLRTIASADRPLSREEIAVGSGVSQTSSGLSAGLRELTELELIQSESSRYRLSRALLE